MTFLAGMARDFNAMKTTATAYGGCDDQMIETLKSAIEAERAKLLAELPQAVEPRLSAIRREIEARELLLARLNRSRVA